jgi:hypothetical protein
MQHARKTSQVGAAALVLAVILGASFSSGTIAQTTSSPTTTVSTLSPSIIKAMQEALNKQGVTVETTGVFDDTTRNALRRFQSQHHLAVTGEADRATLSKLGIADEPTPSPSTIGQAPPATAGSTSPPQAPAQSASGMMSGPMMQGMMQGMMQTMHGMMGMMEGQQPSQMRPMQAAPMQSPSEPTTSDCPMMSGGQVSMPAMRQMMQGMMQMMRTMQNQMQPDQKSQDAQ